MVQCPSCARQQQPRLVCSACDAPLGVELDCFAALGLPPLLSLEPRKLEAVYHDLGRHVHPDRFATGSEALRQASLKSTALLTRSYRTLRDCVGRGLYWLELNGEKLAEDNKLIPAELAELVFEVQEQLAELRVSARSGPAAPGELIAQVRERRDALQAAMQETRQALAEDFAKWDAGQGERQELVRELKMILSKIAYLRTLLRDVDRELESAGAIG